MQRGVLLGTVTLTRPYTVEKTLGSCVCVFDLFISFRCIYYARRDDDDKYSCELLTVKQPVVALKVVVRVC
jgi:hypothetical protein